MRRRIERLSLVAYDGVAIREAGYALSAHIECFRLSDNDVI